jgi:biopolymer transport protein ExbB
MTRRKGLLIAAVVILLTLGAPGAFSQEVADEPTDAATDAESTSATEAEPVIVPEAIAPPPEPAPKATSMAELLERVRTGWNAEADEDRQREERFKRDRDQRAALLERAKATRNYEEVRSDKLEEKFGANELRLAQLEEKRTEKLGALGELFGQVKQTSGDARGLVESSLISAEFPGRTEFLEKLGQSKSLPSIAALEKLWYTFIQEMTESGNVTRFQAPVVDADGKVSDREVIRIGSFNAVSGGKYLVYEGGKLVELPRQPAGTYLDTVAPFESATSGMVRLAIDPSRGSILRVLIETPDAAERVDQGGIVGYTIILLGGLAGILAVVRWLVVFSAARKVAAQRRSDQINQGNPLGRVLGVYDEDPSLDVETLELKLDEVIMRESSSLESWLWAVKVVSVVAPLMGLLGTVTGMIQTFQAITLFGTGDPKMMASGISEALVTTMLGLFVAIPLVLLHALVANSCQGVVQILEEQATGLVARRAQKLDAA